MLDRYLNPSGELQLMREATGDVIERSRADREAVARLLTHMEREYATPVQAPRRQN